MGFFVVSAAGFPALELEYSSECLPWGLDAVFSFESPDTGFPVLVRSKFELFALSVLGCEVHSEPSAVGDRSTVVDTKFHIGFDFATTRSSSPGLSCGLRAEVARCKLCTVHVVEKTEKVIALFKGEIARGEDVGKLVLGVNMFVLDLGIQVDSVNMPIERDSVGTGHTSHCRTSAF